MDLHHRSPTYGAGEFLLLHPAIKNNNVAKILNAYGCRKSQGMKIPIFLFFFFYLENKSIYIAFFFIYSLHALKKRKNKKIHLDIIRNIEASARQSLRPNRQKSKHTATRAIETSTHRATP